ncbi:MAG: ferric reductase-like transmembrane domain-containing protein [Acidobacteriota bacterium]|nr:ferric reductase-like transmembrane domain-containing protein [Acidobacteriota bacterium]
MSHQYVAVGWNRQKKIYDTVMLSCVGLYLTIFVVVDLWLRPNTSPETMLIRALGSCAFLMLHVVLSIGPLARLDTRFLPLLYNRRHLGVTTFLVGAAHGGFALLQFHSQGNVHPLVSLLTSNQRFDSLIDFPFQPLGFVALSILFLMAATSHDFWLTQLTAPMWKTLHMLVYVAYGLLTLHVVLGVLQAETSPLLSGLVLLGFAWIVGIHLLAGFRERGGDRPISEAARDGYVRVCRVDEIRENRAKMAVLSGEKVAIFRYDGKIAAVSNACQHQNGPLGEGKIIDGCITCPWHGYQYRPETGESPPPFTEKVPTFRSRVIDGDVWVHPQPEMKDHTHVG